MASLEQFSNTLDTVINSTNNNINELEDLYVDLWSSYFIEESLFDIDPAFRPIITSVLDSTSELIEEKKFHLMYQRM